MTDPSLAFLSSRLRLERLVAAAADEDPGFRARLRVDPRAAVEDLLGCSLPDSLDLRFVGPGTDTVVAVLRPERPEAPSELSESDLAGLAGGVGSGFDPSVAPEARRYSTLEQAVRTKSRNYRSLAEAPWPGHPK